MPDLNFEILSAQAIKDAALPTLIFKLKIKNSGEEEVYAAALKCQIMIEAVKRQYDTESQEKLVEVFGKPQRWEETMGTLLWTFVTVPVPRFKGETILDVAVSCHEDQAIAAGKYFYSMENGEIPLAFLFSGTLFYSGAGNNVQIMQVPWEKEADYKLPVSTWKQMMHVHFPNFHWLKIDDGIFEKLYKYKAANALPTLEKTIETILDMAIANSKTLQKEKI